MPTTRDIKRRLQTAFTESQAEVLADVIFDPRIIPPGAQTKRRPESPHIERARQRLRDRALARAEQLESMRHRAALDTGAIARMIVEKYQPIRVYQWGSVLRPGGFRAYSDLDLAVEGITDARTFFRMLGDAQAMTRFPLDLVQIEKIEPEYAEDIRRRGKIVYEQR